MSDIRTQDTDGSAKTGFNAADYNAVAKGAELQAINMLSTKFDVRSECLPDQDKWKLSYARRVLSCSVDKEDGFVAALMQYEVLAKYGKKKAFHCTADYGIIYSIPEGADEQAAIGFCRNVGSFAAYPYFRAHVAAMGCNAGVMLPPLPSIASTAHIPKGQAKVIENGEK